MLSSSSLFVGVGGGGVCEQARRGGGAKPRRFPRVQGRRRTRCRGAQRVVSRPPLGARHVSKSGPGFRVASVWTASCERAAGLVHQGSTEQKPGVVDVRNLIFRHSRNDREQIIGYRTGHFNSYIGAERQFCLHTHRDGKQALPLGEAVCRSGRGAVGGNGTRRSSTPTPARPLAHSPAHPRACHHHSN